MSAAMVRPSDYLLATLHHDMDDEAHAVAQAGMQRYQGYLDDLVVEARERQQRKRRLLRPSTWLR